MISVAALPGKPRVNAPQGEVRVAAVGGGGAEGAAATVDAAVPGSCYQR